MRNVPSYSRRQLRKQRRAWIRRNRWLLVVSAFGIVLVGAVWAGSLAPLPQPWQAYLTGAGHAALVAGLVALCQASMVALDQSNVRQLRGAWGEDNTRTVLGTARRRRLVWGWVDSLALRAGDIDHLVVTRHGGVVAIDSKWRNEVSRTDLEIMAASARKAALRAEGVLRTVLVTERGARHRARTRPLTVRPLVVVWGGARDEVPAGAVVAGVEFVGGSRLVSWLRELDDHPVPRESARSALAALADYRDGVTAENADYAK